jgi:hypothetical protein
MDTRSYIDPPNKHKEAELSEKTQGRSNVIGGRNSKKKESKNNRLDTIYIYILAFNFSK